MFSENQETNEPYTFKYTLLKPDKTYFILTMIKEVEEHEFRSNWTLMKKSEVNNKYKYKYRKLKTI